MGRTIKVFKKTSHNGKVVAYLSRRDFVDHISHTSPVDGVVVVEGDYLRGRKVFARVTVTFRYGREEDEVMGLHFSKEFELINAEVVADGGAARAGQETTSPEVERLLQKLGPDARPFCLTLPGPAPGSVTLDPGSKGTSKQLGVTYEVTVYVSEEMEQQPSRRTSVTFPVRKVQHVPLTHHPKHRPATLVARTFTLTPGKVILEVQLERDLYYHGEQVEARINVGNYSKKTVKHLVTQVLQHVEVTVTNTHFSRGVASIESHDGCPIIPGSRFSRSVLITPLPFRTFGVALEGHQQDQDACLASSTITSAYGNADDALGIIVSYSLRVKLNCGAIGGELTADLPFKLMHASPPSPPSSVGRGVILQRAKSVEESIQIEEFSSFRRGRSLTDDLDD
ncbi:hypothetical protein Pmani_031107 [Petrolisthes manimaculis]|uniref:Arrestin C-terminal-like domain-containing protein n=1 Tax=Petrolisthes manimaculis TaxID=1843537 RepID=A0AAE1TSY5_9EUCA|nr:hypothetical protein Pmani_031107 [Petrolisthes manimaculis]